MTPAGHSDPDDRSPPSSDLDEGLAAATTDPYTPPATRAVVEEESPQALPDSAPNSVRHGAMLLGAAALGMTLPAGLIYLSARRSQPGGPVGEFSLMLTATLLLLGLGGCLLALCYFVIARLLRLLRKERSGP